MTWPARTRRHAENRDDRVPATVARATATATEPRAAQIAHLQQIAGNAAVASLLKRPVVARDLDDGAGGRQCGTAARLCQRGRGQPARRRATTSMMWMWCGSPRAIFPSSSRSNQDSTSNPTR